MVKDALSEAEHKMKSALTALDNDLATVRTGRASPALVERLEVDYYGTPTQLQQLATISVPEPRQLVVKPFDPASLKDIERAIQASELGLNPTDDGAVIRVPIPSLTEERRRDMVKLISKLAEDGRVHIRQVRHDLNKDIKAQDHDGKIPEDEAKRLTAEIQKLTDRHIALIDDMLKKKTAEVMEV